MCCQLTPPPMVRFLVGSQERTGLTLIVWISDLIAWKRPSQSESYSVLSPNGTLMPRPNDHLSVNGTPRYMFGTKAQLPASPPVPPSGCNAAGRDPLSWKRADGQIALAATTTCVLCRRTRPAGL